MIAAAFNSLVLPQFLRYCVKESIDTALLEVVASYGNFINTAMTSLFIAATSICIWSVLIVRTKQLPNWQGYLGLLLVGIEIGGLLFDSNLTKLYSFTVFVNGLVLWLIVIGVQIGFSRK